MEYYWLFFVVLTRIFDCTSFFNCTRFLDETPVNCKRFLDAQGLLLFHKCYEQFQTETELVRNMMGLIGNIAEVKELRSRLMNDDYVEIFW